MKSYTSKISVVLLAFESAPSKTNILTSQPYIHFHLKTLHASQKSFFGCNKAMARMTSTSVKERHSIDTTMNAESVKYGYFRKTETVFVVQFFKVGR